MISYKGNLIECLEQAVKDSTWDEKEQKALANILKHKTEFANLTTADATTEDLNRAAWIAENNPYKVFESPWGTGKNITSYGISFYFHENAAGGYNIGRNERNSQKE